MTRKTRYSAIALGSAAVLTLGACGAGATQPAEGADAAPEPGCAAEDGPLRVYLNPWGPVLSDQFTEDTGIATEIADLGGGEILARIAAEANNPQWDVVVLDGHGSLQGLADRGELLTGWSSQSRENLDDRGQSIAPEDNAWLPISEHAAAVIAYNTDVIDAAEAPRTWDDLTEPHYAPVGIADPAVAAPAYPIVSWFFQDRGTEGAEQYFGALMENGLNTYPKNGPVGQALASGEVPVAALQEQNVYELIDAGDPVDFVWPDDGAPGVVRGVAISADTPRPCAAAALVDWLLTAETMGYLMEHGENDGILTPYVTGTDTSSLPQQRPQDAPLLITDGQFAADQEAEIKDWFANQSVR
ncbi:ABC transporter substrate-binding protein [Ruania rhizosphaerae]|uniref:ABC transporter substrate-binding protein n=1 Tax=Ruania rhizosphaerae TaxID=1840413 RepID=UPI001356AAFF|nr:extracellular solute-binding protein [Ruania rhizosphaerae]